jgi:flagellar hook-associated protein 1
VTQLGKLANASAIRQSDGSYNVFIGNGQALVVGTQTLSLTTIPSLNDSSQLTVGYITGSNKVVIPENTLQGGSLGGYLAFRSETLDSAQNALGRIAISLAQTFNDQHQLGQDLNGAIGGAFFLAPTPGVLQDNGTTSTITAVISNSADLTTSDYRFGFDGTNYRLTRLSDNVSVTTTTAPSGASPFTMDGVSITGMVGVASGDGFVIQPTRNGARDLAVAIHDTAKIAAAAPVRTSALLANTGSGVISAGTVNTPSPVNVNLQQPVTITFQTPYNGTFNVTGTGAGLPANNQTYTAGANISFNGWTIQISGTPAAGDVFTVTPNTNGKSDNRNALLLAGLQTKTLIAGSTASYQSAYGQLVSQIGNKTRELEVASSAQESLVTQTRQTQQSLSGVNLDEEAANLIRYQQAYQASAKVIQTAGLLFQSILDIGG